MNSSKKIYQENSYLKTYKSNVISCIKKNDLYHVVLDETIFYPHMSGGQPKDEGTINDIKVIDVIENGDEIIHILPEPISGSVFLVIDFETRFDYMQQHSGQHILSCGFADLYKAKTIGFHLSSDYTTIDLDFCLTDEMIDKVEQYANKIIYENKTISAETYLYDEALKLNLRKPPLKLDFLRILKIQDYDLVACGGTHLKSTGEVGIIKIIKAEKYKSGTRVEFLCGKRALNDYASKHRNIVNLSNLLTCRTDMIYDNFIKVKSDNKDLKKSLVMLQNKINDYIVKELMELSEVKNNVHFIIKYLENTDSKDLRFICSKIVENDNFAVFLISESDASCSFCIGQSENLSYDLKSIFENIKKISGAKGGGSDKLIQGTTDILNKSEELITEVKNLLVK